jgi:hypothetical protein
MPPAEKKKPQKPKVKAEVPSVIPLRIYRPLENLLRDALLFGQNHPSLRASAGSLILAMRNEAEARFSHDTPDVQGLSSILDRTSTGYIHRAPEKDPIKELRRQQHIDGDQELAAEMLADVWRGWQRFLMAGARAYEHKSFITRDRALDPVTVMGPRLLNIWHYVFTPWYNAAKNKRVEGGTSRMVSNAGIVINVITMPVFPGQLDAIAKLEKGTALAVLQSEIRSISNLQERERSRYEQRDGDDDSAGGGSR